MHCLVIEDGDRLILVDSGFGLAEMRKPSDLFGKPAVEMWGIVGDERYTATAEIRRLGLHPERVTDIILTHGDIDHAGGLVDFPNARVHISSEEHALIRDGNPRYVARQFAHGPRFKTYTSSGETWLGLEARPVDLNLSFPIFLIPLFGHTLGHCGVALQTGDTWLLHAGDSYYRHVEIDAPLHPVAALPRNFAADNAARLRSIELLRDLKRTHGDEVVVFSSHDHSEYKSAENPLNIDVSAIPQG